MWLIIKADNKIEYMIEVYDTETLQSITEKIQQMHPITHEVQYSKKKGEQSLPLDKPLSELGLKNRDILFIDSLNLQKNPKRTISGQAEKKRENMMRFKSSGP